MSGHSKWSTIKRKKGKADAARGKKFTRLIREITVSARNGGGNPSANARLRHAVEEAKAINMPAKNIENAIQRGTGELPGVTYTEMTFEGYGPCGVAIIVEIMTDNKNRTVPEIRNIFSKFNGNLGENGCVSWIFVSQGIIMVDKAKIGEDDLMAILLDAGMENMNTEEDGFEVIVSPVNFEKVKLILQEKKIPILSAEITKIPQNTVKVTGSQAQQVLKFMEAVEDHDDVQNVYANFDINEKELAQITS